MSKQETLEGHPSIKTVTTLPKTTQNKFLGFLKSLPYFHALLHRSVDDLKKQSAFLAPVSEGAERTSSFTQNSWVSCPAAPGRTAQRVRL